MQERNDNTFSHPTRKCWHMHHVHFL